MGQHKTVAIVDASSLRETSMSSPKATRRRQASSLIWSASQSHRLTVRRIDDGELAARSANDRQQGHLDDPGLAGFHERTQQMIRIVEVEDACDLKSLEFFVGDDDPSAAVAL